MTNPHSPFRLNIGFISHQSVGFVRDFPFEVAAFHFPPDLDLTDLNGIARITRTPQGLLVQIKMRASISSECVRCLTDFPQVLETDFTELYAFSRRSVTDSELLLPEDGHIDLEPLLREYMLLEIPISALCREDCKGLCLICGENLNEINCGHEQTTVDPRLSSLQSFLDPDDLPQE